MPGLGRVSVNPYFLAGDIDILLLLVGMTVSRGIFLKKENC